MELNISAFPDHDVDTTAAGDCFVGALAVALCEGKLLVFAAEFASAAAAISFPWNGHNNPFSVARKSRSS